MSINKVPINLVLTRYGRQLYLPTDIYVGKSLDVYAEFSPEEGTLLYSLVKGKNVIEVGANMGALTLPLAVSAKQIWAYEPQSFLAKLLATIPIFNGLSNLTVINKAVGAEAGTLHLPMFDYCVNNNYGGYGQEFWDSAKAADFELVPVPVVTLDEEFLNKDLPLGGKIDFIKIDVEGMEADVLMGAKALLARDKPVLYVENDRPPKAQALVTLLDNLGYSCYWHCPSLFSPNNFAGNPENIFRGIISFNLLCIPEGGAWFEVHPGASRATPENPHIPTIPYPYA